MTTKKNSFHQFLHYFPEIELPVSLTDELFDEIRRVNDDLPGPLVFEFIPGAKEETDEFTEYFPCFRIPETGDFIAVVYWKASLMQYEFHLVTYTPKGELIAGKVIAQTLTNGQTIIRSVATIDEDHIIKVVSGEMEVKKMEYDAQDSKAHTMELLSTGDIIFSLNEDLYEE